MGLEALVRDHSGTRRYRRLRSDVAAGQEEPETPITTSPVVGRGRRRLRLRAAGRGRAVLFRVARSARRPVRLVRLLLAAPVRRVVALYAEFLRRAMSLEYAEFPAVVFASQWGLPVLSHAASSPPAAAHRNARLRAFYLERSLSAASSC